MFPNPADKYININLDPGLAENVTITICDLTGRNLIVRQAEKNLHGGRFMSVDVSKLPSGSYLVVASSYEKTFKPVKMLVSH